MRGIVGLNCGNLPVSSHFSSWANAQSWLIFMVAACLYGPQFSEQKKKKEKKKRKKKDRENYDYKSL